MYAYKSSMEYVIFSLCGADCFNFVSNDANSWSTACWREGKSSHRRGPVGVDWERRMKWEDGEDMDGMGEG